MRTILFNRHFSLLPIVLLLPLLLSGCLRGFFGWGKSAPPTQKIEHQAAAEKEGSAARTPAEKPAPNKSNQTPPAVEEAALSRRLFPQDPESLLPLTVAAEQPASGQGRDATPGQERGLVAPRPPDRSYSNAQLTEDTVWQGEVRVEGEVTIAPQATLTLKEGTVVRFRDSAGGHGVLVVQGRIVAEGSAEKPVVFTSRNDDGTTGAWQGIVLLASGKKNVLEQCRIEGAEIGIDASFSTITLKHASFRKCRTGARLQDTLAVITGSSAGECGTGVILYDSEAEIRSTDFFGNRVGLFAARTSLALAGSRFTGNNLLGLSADACRLQLSGNNFTANSSGLILTGCEGTLTTNRITHNAAYGLVLGRSRAKVTANEVTGNAKVGLWVEDGMGMAWGNALFANGEYDLYNAGKEAFRAIGNWWGEGAVDVGARIYDQRLDGRRGRVLYTPVAHARPVLDTQ